MTKKHTPLNLAVVGHTNTGKTSILRTLLRDKYFGEVKNATATTRHVERAIITDNNNENELVYLFDTPGLEDATGVMDWLADNTSSRKDGIERLQRFLNYQSADNSNDFSQEQKVIRQLLASDIAVYVIDAREPVLSKYRDELAILSWSAVPVMPVFNFIGAKNNYIEQWQTMLARQNLHISSQFDSVAFEFNDEMQLWQNLSTLLKQDKRLNQLIDYRQENWHHLFEEATIIIADFLLNVTSFTKVIDEEDDPEPVLKNMQTVVRQAERNMHQDLLNLYKFYDDEVATTSLSLQEYEQNPFNSELLKRYGIRTTSGATVGALLGMGIDVATFGTTMGLGTAFGGFLGGLLPNSGKIIDIVKGKKQLQIDPATITLLATRALEVLAILRHRGHASQEHNITDENIENAPNPLMPWSANKLPQELIQARTKPEWSSLDGQHSKQAKLLRKDMAWKLAYRLSSTEK